MYPQLLTIGKNKLSLQITTLIRYSLNSTIQILAKQLPLCHTRFELNVTPPNLLSTTMSNFISEQGFANFIK